MTKTRKAKTDDKSKLWHCRITYGIQDLKKEERKFWQERKRGWQKLAKLDEQKYKTQQKLSEAVVERIDKTLEGLKNRNETLPR